MARNDQLAEYRSKRDLAKSGEPSGPRRKRARKGRRFVVQRHDASTLHFDFRVQVGDVLVSWSVPKGPKLHGRQQWLLIKKDDEGADRRRSGSPT